MDAVDAAEVFRTLQIRICESALLLAARAHIHKSILKSRNSNKLITRSNLNTQRYNGTDADVESARSKQDTEQRSIKYSTNIAFFFRSVCIKWANCCTIYNPTCIQVAPPEINPKRKAENNHNTERWTANMRITYCVYTQRRLAPHWACIQHAVDLIIICKWFCNELKENDNKIKPNCNRSAIGNGIALQCGVCYTNPTA